MSILYIDCGMGAAGDMLTAALLELLPAEERESFPAEFNELGIPGVVMKAEQKVSQGVTGTHVTVTVHGVEEGEVLHGDMYGSDSRSSMHNHAHDHSGAAHEHSHAHAHMHTHRHEAAGNDEAGDNHGAVHSHVHNGLAEIEHIVNEHIDLPGHIKADILNVYDIIADAESKAHGVPVTDIHFHEVGTLDAVADVTAVCLLMSRLAPERILASPVNTGRGWVRCAHGLLPVPTPATANILEGIPNYAGETESELCTPTGAALLKYFASSFEELPQTDCIRAGGRTYSLARMGCGMGTKEFDRPNCVRIYLFE